MIDYSLLCVPHGSPTIPIICMWMELMYSFSALETFSELALYESTLIDFVCADPTYDYGPESRTIEVLPGDESIFHAPSDMFMSSLAAGEHQLYVLHRDHANIFSIVVCNAYGWDIQSRQRHLSDTFRFQIARRLGIGKLHSVCNVRCLQVAIFPVCYCIHYSWYVSLFSIVYICLEPVARLHY